jgi:hypothetical protein
MQHLWHNFNDLPAMPPHPDTRGIGRSGVAFNKADGGSATLAIPIEQEGDSDLEENPDDFVVQANLSARQAATTDKQSLEADATAGGLIPKRPRRSCTLKSGKSRLL